MDPASYRYKPRRRGQADLEKRIREICETRGVLISTITGETMSQNSFATAIGIRRTISELPTIALPFSEFEKLVQPTAVADHVLVELDRQSLLLKGADGGLRRQIQITGLGNRRQRYRI
jgi:hypothetical protein